MLHILSNRTFATLFAAQCVALLGTGLLTVALGLLAFDLAGGQAGVVLGTALAIKMMAYVGLAPVAQALAAGLPRKVVLIGADLIRAATALLLPFVTEVWQIYLLIFVLQAASATFTPAFQSAIPEVLPDERDYTRALSLSRLAYDLESLASPALAALLLLVMPFAALFVGTVAGFLASAGLVFSVRVPNAQAVSRPFIERLTRGTRLYLATPRLRGLLALCMATAAPGAFVLVNTVVVARVSYGLGEAAVALALAAFGAGSMVAALILPQMLDRIGDRRLMIGAALLLGLITMAAGAAFIWGGGPSWPVLLAVWAASGFLYSAILTPSGRLLRASSGPEDRPALFAAHFALSHACWLLTYPLAGWAGAALGNGAALLMLGMIGLGAAVVARQLWPGDAMRGP